ncbi:MAG: Ser-Thr-rich GPI-anchored membrane family protein [Bacteroidota bacterium]
MPILTNKLALTLFFVWLPLFLVAQKISDFKYKLVGEKIEIVYSLGGKSSDRYEVSLYSDLDDYATPLALVTGDVGYDIVPGRNKKITWNVKEELGEYKGAFSLKLKTKFIPFVVFDIPKDSKFKRGTIKVIHWEASKPDTLKLELYLGARRISNLTVLSPSINNYTWEIPKDLELIHGYKIKATGIERIAYSESFTIKRKVPLAAWVVPAAVVVGSAVAVLIVTGGDGRQPIPMPPLDPN